MVKRKSYNPFKMWGSYLGAIIGFFIPWPFPLGGFVSGFTILTLNIDELYNPYIWFFVFAGALVSFVIGWGIHSLFRFIWSRSRR